MQVKDLSKRLGITNKELIAFFVDNGFSVKNHMAVVTPEMEELAVGSLDSTPVVVPPPAIEKPVEKTFSQHDPILCRSVTPGWLGIPGKSGQYYVFTNIGDEQEIEYQDLFALKNSRSAYLFEPLIVIENDDLLDNPRWKDISAFYNDKIYGMDNVNEVLNMPTNVFKQTLQGLPKGLLKAVVVEVAQRIENRTFDSLTKINMIDDVAGTDFKHIMQFD